MYYTILLFIPCKPLNVILSKMSDFALRAVLKETIFGLHHFHILHIVLLDCAVGLTFKKMPRSDLLKVLY